MSSKITYFLAILAANIIGCYFYYQNCCGTTTKQAQMPLEVKEMRPFLVSGSGFSYQSQTNFNFLKDQYKTLQPVADSVNQGIAKVMEFLKDEKQYLKITGYAHAEEVNSSIFPNLGYARANSVKNYLVSKGIPASKIAIHGQILEGLSVYRDTLFGPVAFLLSTDSQTKSVSDWKKVKDSLNTPPLTLYFETGAAQIALSETQRDKVAQMVNYIDHVPNATLSIVGHTDTMGTPENNMVLGQERADFAKKYLIENGISPEKIATTSKGQNEPIATNDTEDGRAKNRRTVIQIN